MNENEQETRINLGFTEERFPPGGHMCLIYNDEAERCRVVGQFLQAGLENGEQVGYLADDVNTDQIRQMLVSLGVDCATLEARRQLLLLTTQESYFPDGTFTPAAMLGRLRKLYAASKAGGWRHFRASGEMQWALGNVPGACHLFEYECLLNDLVLECPIIPICQYDARRFSGAALFAALQVHPLMVVHGQVVRNPYYVDVKQWLARWGGAFQGSLGQ
ncbi:MAG: MEDS domain-containing protein [Magnetococcales bacterium]|nr:MEDS domain-containing protein [Magnetococcales bacterium]